MGGEEAKQLSSSTLQFSRDIIIITKQAGRNRHKSEFSSHFLFLLLLRSPNLSAKFENVFQLFDGGFLSIFL